MIAILDVESTLLMNVNVGNAWVDGAAERGRPVSDLQEIRAQLQYSSHHNNKYS